MAGAKKGKGKAANKKNNKKTKESPTETPSTPTTETPEQQQEQQQQEEQQQPPPEQDPAQEPASEPTAEATTEATPETAPEPVPESAPEPASEPAPEPEPTSELAPETAPEPTPESLEPAAEPAAESTTEPTTESFEPAPEPTTESAFEPTTDAAPEAVAEAAPEPTTESFEPTTEPAQETTPETTQESWEESFEPAAETVTEPTTEVAPETVQEPAAESFEQPTETPEAPAESWGESFEPAPEPTAEPTTESFEPAAEATQEAAFEPAGDSAAETLPQSAFEPTPETAPETVQDSAFDPAPETTLETSTEPLAAEPTVESTLAPAEEPVLAPEPEPSVELDQEQPQAAVEQSSAPFDIEEQPQPSFNVDETDSLNKDSSDFFANHEPAVNDVANNSELLEASQPEELGAPEPLTEGVEAHDNNVVEEQHDPAEQLEQLAATAPQTPIFSPAPAPVPQQSPSWTEARNIASPPRSRAASPSFAAYASPTSNATPEHRAASPKPQTASPVQQAAYPASKPASPVPRVRSSIPKPASPSWKPASPANSKPASPVMKAASPIQKPVSPVLKNSSPRQRAASPVQKIASPVAKPASPAPKVSSPLARPYNYMHPMMSPHATPPSMAMPVAPTAPPSTVPSYQTALHSPVMSSSGMVPPYMPYQYAPPTQHQYANMQNGHPAARGFIDPAYASSFQAIRELSMANGHGLDHKGQMSPPEGDGEHIELLQRIQDAIPDLSRLLHGYKSTQSKLATREAEMKQLESQNEQAIMHKDFYIEALQNQMRKAANESAEEGAKLKNTINELRMELGNLEEKQKDLEESLNDSDNRNKELSMAKIELERQVTKLNTNLQEEKEAHEKEIQKKNEEHADALATQKQELTELFEEIKAEDEKAAAEALEARERQLLDQQESMKNDYENQKQQMQEAHDTLQSNFDEKVTELTSTKEELDTTKTELETKVGELESTTAELGSTQADLTTTREELAGKIAELDETRQQHAEELESLHAAHEAKVNDLEGQISEKSEIIATLEKENERLQDDGIHKEKQIQHASEGMRLTIDNLDKDCERLRKTLHSLGEATDLKSTKGDPFFLDCFAQLSRLIADLSKEHFAYLPIDPPKDILSKIPPELPSFLDNTPASRELRSAYVQHVISKTLTYRIFQPFLFTLGRRYDKADTFFSMLSMDIRRKSVRREAFWRQQTLKAAYTTSDAKHSINVVASCIVDEIVDHVKHFADPKHLDALLTGVRRIVKLAAETWRLARVERELILATIPSPESDGVSNEVWEEYGPPKEGSLSSKVEPTRHVILRTFPQVTREAAHEDFAGDEEKTRPCVYSHGSVLYSDSPVVMARLQELAGTLDGTSSPRSPRSRQGSKDSLKGELPGAEGVKA